MTADWKEKVMCAIECQRCHKSLKANDERILSCYDHEAICMECKEAEETRPDYEEVTKNMIAQCTVDIEMAQGDPGSYCYCHFYPYKC